MESTPLNKYGLGNGYQHMKPWKPTWRVYAPSIACLLVVGLVAAVAIGMGSIVLGCVCLALGLLCLMYIYYLYSIYRHEAHMYTDDFVQYIVFKDQLGRNVGIYRYLGEVNGIDVLERYEMVNGNLKSTGRW